MSDGGAPPVEGGRDSAAPVDSGSDGNVAVDSGDAMATPDVSATCTAGQVGCTASNAPWSCVGGVQSPGAPCAGGTCNPNTGMCAAPCTQGAKQCTGLEVQTCMGGVWTDTAACTVGCANAACLTATAITAGASHTCALLSNGTVACWGLNTSGQLGNGATTSSSTPVPVSNLTGVTTLSAGDAFTCALLTSGTVMCWGDNTAGQLGNGSPATSSSTPVPVFAQDGGAAGAIGIAAGGNDACLLLGPNNPQNEAVWCWGANNYNIFSTTNGNVTTPLAIGGMNQATSLSIGEDFLCGIVTIHQGVIECMGYNGFGNLGCCQTMNASGSPVDVDNGTALGATVVAAGGAYGHHACALISGAVQCWGENSNYELGDNSTSGMYSDTPVPVSNISSAMAISVGSQSSCAVLMSGAVQCWGDNTWGQLGNNGVLASPVPVNVVGITNATAVAEGEDHTCALLATGEVECWGANPDGELGNGKTSSAATTTPVAVVW